MYSCGGPCIAMEGHVQSCGGQCIAMESHVQL